MRNLNFPNEIAAILQNILSNLVKHSDVKSINIRTAKDENNVTIKIKDDANPLTNTQKAIILNGIYSNKDHLFMNDKKGVGLKIIRNALLNTKAKLDLSVNKSRNTSTLTIP